MTNFNFEAFLIAFGLIFLAELGDKTQLMVITLSAREKKPFLIGVAASIGISLVAIIGIIVGISFTYFIPIIWIKIFGVVIFFLFGSYILIKLYRDQHHLDKEGREDSELAKKSRINIKNMFLFSLVSVFLMEFGDKTQIMTITLTASYIAPFEVGLGAVLSLSLLCFIGAYLGGLISKKLPKRWIELGTGVFFIIMGVLLLLEALITL